MLTFHITCDPNVPCLPLSVISPEPLIDDSTYNASDDYYSYPALGYVHQNYIPTSLNDFDMLALLGMGASAKVYVASRKTSGDLVALKCISTTSVLNDFSNLRSVTFMEKRVLMSSVNSPFIIKLYSTFRTVSHLIYAVEFVSGNSVMHHLFLAPNGYFDIDRARFYAAEIACAIEYLHSLRIIHRDIKTDNVLLTHDGHVKVADFGLSFMGEQQATTICGTPSYMAPEIVMNQGYDKTVDWWSLGCFIYEMLTGEVPFALDTRFQLGRNNLSELVRNYEKNFPNLERIEDESARSILKKLLVIDPALRLQNLEQLKREPFFHSDDWNWDDLEAGRANPPELLQHHSYGRIITNPVTNEEIDLSYFDNYYNDAKLSSIRSDLANVIASRSDFLRNFSFSIFSADK